MREEVDVVETVVVHSDCPSSAVLACRMEAVRADRIPACLDDRRDDKEQQSNPKMEEKTVVVFVIRKRGEMNTWTQKREIQ